MAPLGRFGAGGFSHMQGAPVGTTEGRGDALLSFQGPANRVPARTLTGFPQVPSDHLYELVGDDGEEQMSFGAGWACGGRWARSPSSDFSDRKTASRSVRVM